MPKLTKKEMRAIYRALGLITCMGVTVVACIGFGLLIGWVLDGWLGSTPWMQLVFTLLSIIAAIKAIYDMAIKVDKED